MSIKEKADQIHAEQERQRRSALTDAEKKCRELLPLLENSVSSLNQRIRSELAPYVKVVQDTDFMKVFNDLIATERLTEWKGRLLSSLAKVQTQYDWEGGEIKNHYANVAGGRLIHLYDKHHLREYGQEKYKEKIFYKNIAIAEVRGNKRIDGVPGTILHRPSTNGLVYGNDRPYFYTFGLQNLDPFHRAAYLEYAVDRFNGLNQGNLHLRSLKFGIIYHRHDRAVREDDFGPLVAKVYGEHLEIDLTRDSGEDIVFRYQERALSSKEALRDKDALEWFILQAYLSYSSEIDD